MIILQFQGPFTGPLEPSQNMFRGGCQVFQVGQAPSGPTVIRPLPTGRSLCTTSEKYTMSAEVFGV